MLFQSNCEGHWTHGLLPVTSSSHKMEAVSLLLKGALLMDKSGVRPLVGLIVSSFALEETWRASSLAPNVLLVRKHV